MLVDGREMTEEQAKLYLQCREFEQMRIDGLTEEVMCVECHTILGYTDKDSVEVGMICTGCKK